MDLGFYQGLLPAASQTKAKFLALFRAVLDHAAALGTLADAAMFDAFDLDNAAGAQLDTLGALVGVDRSSSVNAAGLDDDLFRIMIMAKIGQNVWDGSNEGFIDIWRSMVGQVVSAEYIDNMDGTVTIRVLDGSWPELNAAMASGQLIPFPAGVTVVFIAPTAVTAETTYAGAAVMAAFSRIELQTV